MTEHGIRRRFSREYAPRATDAMTQINEPSGVTAYQCRTQADDRRPDMSATVLEFPSCRAREHRSWPAVEQACSQVIRFPNRPSSLTQEDLDVLTAVAASSAGEWLCEMERDCNGAVRAVFVSGRSDGQDRAAFLLCPSERKLLLIDAQLADDWRLLGTFDCVERLAFALCRMIDGQPWR